MLFYGINKDGYPVTDIVTIPVFEGDDVLAKLYCGQKDLMSKYPKKLEFNDEFSKTFVKLILEKVKNNEVTHITFEI
jgi:hypothetical protein